MNKKCLVCISKHKCPRGGPAFLSQVTVTQKTEEEVGSFIAISMIQKEAALIGFPRDMYSISLAVS